MGMFTSFTAFIFASTPCAVPQELPRPSWCAQSNPPLARHLCGIRGRSVSAGTSPTDQQSFARLCTSIAVWMESTYVIRRLLSGLQKIRAWRIFESDMGQSSPQPESVLRALLHYPYDFILTAASTFRRKALRALRCRSVKTGVLFVFVIRICFEFRFSTFGFSLPI